MGRRGPPRKPTHLKVLAGNPGKRPLNPFEPKPEMEAPTCPRWLSPEARRVWRYSVPLLKRMRVLALVDRDALVAYCVTYARWQKTEKFLVEHGEVYPIKDAVGRVLSMAQFPQVAIARNLLQAVRAYQLEFGLTPSARSRLHAQPGPNPMGRAARLRCT